MCLAIPARVSWAEGHEAVVEIQGNRRRVDITLVDGVRAGQYVLVHAGIALQVLDEEEAEETLALIRGALGDD
ncbi:MAG TPA: HypC/HybG/HupF family hydrogenase formation chaperone [Symbiobacteriaceae bacterium]|nr:HypC/HybG/HupF family hydrogenase formation chaperone [Symbiobacteriaceae bacterium]